MSSPLQIDITVLHPEWPDIASLIDHASRETLKAIGLQGASELSIVLSDDAFVQNLNKTYRGKDKPTNVLSFSQLEGETPDIPGMTSLGDVVMAYETVLREAEEQGKSFTDHTVHLIVHGILHLLGHDHENDAEAENMEGLEIRILQNLGIKNPYIT